MRLLVLALAALVLTTPDAEAALSDRYLPIHTLPVGKRADGATYVRLPAELYREVAGRARRPTAAAASPMPPATGAACA